MKFIKFTKAYSLFVQTNHSPKAWNLQVRTVSKVVRVRIGVKGVSTYFLSVREWRKE